MNNTAEWQFNYVYFIEKKNTKSHLTNEEPFCIEPEIVKSSANAIYRI